MLQTRKKKIYYNYNDCRKGPEACAIELLPLRLAGHEARLVCGCPLPFVAVCRRGCWNLCFSFSAGVSLTVLADSVRVGIEVLLLPVIGSTVSTVGGLGCQ